jgi:UDP:flavonoid glycosyltransferase YjiC (YdhE family)
VDNKDFSGLCSAMNVEYVKAPEKMAFDIPDLIEKHTTSGMMTRNVMFAKLLMKNLFYPCQEAMLEAARDACRNADIAIGHFLCYPLRIAAQERNIPYASLTYWPGLVPSVHCLQPGLPNLGRLVNTLGWALAKGTLNILLKKDVSRFWEDSGMPPFGDILQEVFLSSTLNLIAASPTLCPRMPDWKNEHVLCGFLNVPDFAEDWKMPDDLKEFLADGPSPAFTGFGSLQQINPDNCAELMIKTANLAKCRAIIQTSSEKFPPGRLSESIYCIDTVPHEKIYPECAAVMHHCGAGTSHTALRCGCPAIPVPFLEEQLSWGRMLRKAGVAAKPVQFARATPEKLARNLSIALNSETMKKKAMENAAQLQKENGGLTAVQALEQLIG